MFGQRLPCLLFRHRPFLLAPVSFRRCRRRVAAAGPCFARIARGRAGIVAPARFARLIAPAREANAGRICPARSRRGFFEAPAALLRRKAKGGPGSRLSVLILPHFFSGQAPRWAIPEKIPEIPLQTAPASNRTPSPRPPRRKTDPQASAPSSAQRQNRRLPFGRPDLRSRRISA